MGKSKLLAVISTFAVTATLLGFSGGAQAQGRFEEPRLLGTYSPPSSSAAEAVIISPVGGETKKCLSTDSGEVCTELQDSTEVAARGATELAVQADEPSCSLEPGIWRHTRKTYCATHKGTYTEYDSSTPGKVLGTAIFTTYQAATLSQTSGTWEETQKVTMGTTTGVVTSVDFSWTSMCSLGCTPTKPSPWTGSQNLRAGQTATGTSKFTVTPSAGAYASVSTSYALMALKPGSVPLNPEANIGNPRKVRCDKMFANNTSTGCVHADARPQLVLPLSQYGAAAATYAWAQQKLVDRWGSASNPLRRLADSAAAEGNRTRVCGEGATRPFTHRPDLVVNDSCDEYPFAATHEGGRNGALCADVIPLLENGVWQFYGDPAAPDVTGNEPCIRGHVPLEQNTAAGGKLGSNSQTERIIPDEKFEVVITN